MKTNIHFLSYLAQFFLERELFQTKLAEKIKTHVLCSLNSLFLLFFFENCTVYEVMWNNTVQPGRSQMTIWRMRIACSTPKATNTHSEYVTLTAFPR